MLFLFWPRKNEAYSDADEAPQGHQRNCNEPEQLELFGIAWNAFRTRRDALGDQADIKQIVIDRYSQAYQANGQGVTGDIAIAHSDADADDHDQRIKSDPLIPA